MKCFYHHDKDAVGVCSNCFKAMCENEATELNGKLLCTNCKAVIMAKLQAQASQMQPASARQQQPQGQKKESGGVGSLIKMIVPRDPNLQIKNEDLPLLIVPIFFGGVIGGLFASVPFINLLFFITVPFGVGLSLVFLKAEEKFRYAISGIDALKIGAACGVVIALVGSLGLFVWQIFLAQAAFEFFSKTAQAISYQEADIIMKIAGFDKDLAIELIILRLFAMLASYPIVGALSGKFFASKMR
ncbi:hypothetical protein FJZ26_03615 [Candidatus Parvarchaeota archaeon]|nr:hypothetical protein [Candidatus Parvarchaeota archaeon]